MTSLEDFSLLYSKLVTVFGEYSKNASGKCAIYHEKLAHIDYETMYKAIEYATANSKRFPSVAELKEIIQNLNPQDGSAESSFANEESHFNHRMAICDAITAALQHLSPEKQDHIVNIANKQLRDNAPDWYTPEMKRRAFQGFCIMAFKSLCPDETSQIYAQKQLPLSQKPFTPLPFNQPRQITTTIIRNTPPAPILDVM
jgi:hypothetical protein